MQDAERDAGRLTFDVFVCMRILVCGWKAGCLLGMFAALWMCCAEGCFGKFFMGGGVVFVLRPKPRQLL
jgi:hypothetical protein